MPHRLLKPSDDLPISSSYHGPQTHLLRPPGRRRGITERSRLDSVGSYHRARLLSGRREMDNSNLSIVSFLGNLDNLDQGKYNLDNLDQGYGTTPGDEEGQETSPLVHSQDEDEGDAPPDGGWGWVVVIAAFICNMVLDGICYSFGVLMVPLMTYYGSGRGPVAAVGSVLAGIYMLMGPVVASLIHRYGMRPVCISGSIVSCLALLLSTFSESLPLLTFSYGVLGGIGFGLMFVPAVVAPGLYFTTKRSLATGVAVCGTGAGTFLVAPLTAVLVDKFNWKTTNRIYCAVCLLTVGCGAVMKPLNYRANNNNNNESSTSTVVSQDKSCLDKTVYRVVDRKLLTNVPFLIILVGNVLALAGVYIPYTFLPELATDCGLAPESAALMVSVLGVANTIGRIIMGTLADLPAINPLLLIVFTLIGGGICCIGLAYCTSVVSLLVVTVLFGLNLSAFPAVTSASLVDLLGIEMLTSSFGLLTAIRGISSALGPPLGGILIDSLPGHKVAPVFVLSGGLLIGGALVMGAAWAISKKQTRLDYEDLSSSD